MVAVNSRASALHLLAQILDKRQELDRVFDDAVRGLEGRDRAFVRMLVATTLRHLNQCDDLISSHVEKHPDPQSMHILRLGVTQMLFMDVEDHAAIGETVSLAHGRKTKFINAVLRSIQRMRDGSTDFDFEGIPNIPDWLVQQWIKDYGPDTARLIAEESASQAPMQVTWRDGRNTIYSGSVAAMLEDPDYQKGDFWVQDQAASMAVPVLADFFQGSLQGKTILDACAAPGGKTLQLAAAGANIVALDRSEKRLDRLRENLERTHLSAEVVCDDFLSYEPNSSFDAILLDAPCSATGTIRRHPDLPWIKREEDIEKLVQAQARFLEHAKRFACPILYATCSLQKSEGEGHIKNMRGYTLQQERRILPNSLEGGNDGFYIAMLTPDGVQP